VKESKNGELSDFERGQIIGARLGGASVTKTGTLLSVSLEQFLWLRQHS
jgi:hypothetical protein